MNRFQWQFLDSDVYPCFPTLGITKLSEDQCFDCLDALDTGILRARATKTVPMPQVEQDIWQDIHDTIEVHRPGSKYQILKIAQEEVYKHVRT